MIFAVLFSSLLALIENERYVIYVLIVVSYILPYIVHTNTFDRVEVVASSIGGKDETSKEKVKKHRRR